ncbi:unnamed protein product (macronuclear) [Paramecium tetraurelia]|uniref:Uncharacterized protein n=1 Tax=Paramecium tetraurelia TaxID=5888 RepID=A0BZF6_PARTE|nr:uncharacterized protein GSPATT00033776001 [Paramecium tetraurelia]CAK63923.1 unnamed protein product [Paramecium tetraurelia]|eukprot:XP_001431321.1 hypothetical protein (macronuclear) [Paramecium tetraurelia strain d4-2]
MNFFGSKKAQAPPPEPKLQSMTKEELRDKQRSMNKELQKEMREIERQNFQIEQARKKAEDLLQKEIKKGDKADKFIKQTYAKQVITCQKQKERNLLNKGKIQNVMYGIDNMFANIKMAQAMGCISNVMKDINKLMNIKEISATMQDLQKEMMKMGIVQEQMDDAMENMNDDVDLGDMQSQADDLIYQIESQQAGPNKQLPQQQQMKQQEANQDLDDFEKKLQQL